MTTCPACSFDNRDGVRFCEHCGTDLPPVEPALAVCRVCGVQPRPGVSFCEACGQPLEEKTAGSEPRVVPVPEAKHSGLDHIDCGECGTGNRLGLRFCEYCGAELRSHVQSVPARASFSPLKSRRWYGRAAAIGALVVAVGGVAAWQLADGGTDDGLATQGAEALVATTTSAGSSSALLPSGGNVPSVALPELVQHMGEVMADLPGSVDPSRGFVMRLDDGSAAVYDGAVWSIVRSSGIGELEIWRPGITVGAIEQHGDRQVYVPSPDIPEGMADWVDARLESMPGLERLGDGFVVMSPEEFSAAAEAGALEGMSWRDSPGGPVLVDDLESGFVNVAVQGDHTWIQREDGLVLAIPDPAGDDGDVVPVGLLSSCAARGDLVGCSQRSDSDTQMFWDPSPGVSEPLARQAALVLDSLPWLAADGAGGWFAPDIHLEAPAPPDPQVSAGIWADVEEFLESGAEAAWLSVDPAWAPQVVTAEQMANRIEGDPEAGPVEVMAGLFPGRLVWPERSEVAGFSIEASPVATARFLSGGDDSAGSSCKCNKWLLCGNCPDVVLDKVQDVGGGTIRVIGSAADDVGGWVGGGLKSGWNMGLEGLDWLADTGKRATVTLLEGGAKVAVTIYENNGMKTVFEFYVDTWTRILSAIKKCVTWKGCGHPPPSEDVPYSPPPDLTEFGEFADPTQAAEYAERTHLARTWFPYLQFSAEETCGDVLRIVADVFPYGPGGIPVPRLAQAQYVEIIYTVFYKEDGGRLCGIDRHAGDNEGFGIGLVRTDKTAERCSSGFEFVGARSSAHKNWEPVDNAVIAYLAKRYGSHITSDELTAAEAGACPPLRSPGDYVVLVAEDKHASYFHRDKCEEELPALKNALADVVGAFVTGSAPGGSGVVWGPATQQAISAGVELLPGSGGLEECEDGRDPVDLAGMVRVFRDDDPMMNEEYAHGQCKAWQSDEDTGEWKEYDYVSYRCGARGRWRPDTRWEPDLVCGVVPPLADTIGSCDDDCAPADGTWRTTSDHNFHIDGLFGARPISLATVPDVIGMDEEAACREFAKAGFLSTFASISSVDDPALEGTVTDQDPAGRRRSTVGSVVACALGDYSDLGPDAVQMTIVPDVIGDTEAVARHQIERAGLVFARRTRSVSDMADDGIVLDQDPRGDSSNPVGPMVAENTTVTVTVGVFIPPAGETCGGRQATKIGTEGADTLTGTSGVDVIVGLGGDDTIYASDGNDFICGGDGDDKLYGESGYDQTFGGNGFDWCDGEVDVSCEDGPGSGVPVPDVGGWCVSDAMTELTNAGLFINDHDVQGELCGEHNSSCWEVTGQSPAAGSLVDEGTSVTLSVAWFGVCSGVDVTVPDVIGSCSSDADSWLTSLGLLSVESSLGYLCPDIEYESSCWEVIDQDPPGGSEVPEGSSVVLETGWYAEEACSS